ncbi:MAG: nitronate monooxygenase [bacterium]|nr:nitronate monooxygenase [bacterium]
MELPKLQIGNLIAEVPIVQGGMGVRVSLASLATAVANEGGIGTISSMGLGDLRLAGKEFETRSREALIREIHKAESLTSGILAVNVMGALSNAADLVRAAIEGGIRLIVFGAGLPMKLPAIAESPDVNLVPIISSSRVATLIMRAWKKRYDRTVDAFIIEGPLAGGHLGYSREQLEHPEDCSLEKSLGEVLEAIKPYEDDWGRKIPIIVAGGIYDGKDIDRMLSLGASGVQMGTRFVCTSECGAAAEFKQAYLDAKEEDIAIVKSPVGMPGRAIYNRFLKTIDEKGRQKIKCAYRCLTSCKIKDAKYCIAQALLNSVSGDVDRGLIFCGTNAFRVDKIVSVKALFQELLSGWQVAVARRTPVQVASTSRKGP